MVAAESPWCGSERPDPSPACHNTPVAPRQQRGHAPAAADPHQPHTFKVTRGAFDNT